MRILLIHDIYSIRGGEERTVDAQQQLLEADGHLVERHELRNDEVFGRSRWRALKAAWRAPWNEPAAAQVLELARRFQPDVAHVHNWFPLLSPAVHAALRVEGIPVVQSLHNYRMGCAAGTYLRDGRDCRDCLGGSRLPALRHGCYRGSRLQTLGWWRVAERGWKRGAFPAAADAFVAPSEVVAQRHREMGLPADRVHVVPHATPAPELRVRETPPPGSGAVFVGRLVPEKGAALLLEAWRDSAFPLDLLGEGPQLDELRGLARDQPGIRLRGAVSHAEVMRRLADAALLVFPSAWEEPFGLGLIEAMACGRPVVASRIGAIPEIVEDGVTGLLVPPGNPAALRSAADRLLADRELRAEMGRAARSRWRREHHPAVHRRRLLSVYRRLRNERRAA